jgi:hypothetical protein
VLNGSRVKLSKVLSILSSGAVSNGFLSREGHVQIRPCSRDGRLSFQPWKRGPTGDDLQLLSSPHISDASGKGVWSLQLLQTPTASSPKSTRVRKWAPFALNEACDELNMHVNRGPCIIRRGHAVLSVAFRYSQSASVDIRGFCSSRSLNLVHFLPLQRWPLAGGKKLFFLALSIDFRAATWSMKRPGSEISAGTGLTPRVLHYATNSAFGKQGREVLSSNPCLRSQSWPSNAWALLFFLRLLSIPDVGARVLDIDST